MYSTGRDKIRLYEIGALKVNNREEREEVVFIPEEEEWYAMEIFGDDFHGVFTGEMDYSPIKVITFEEAEGYYFNLVFYHAWYPAGVQGKKYTIEVIQTGEHYILARSVDHDPVRVLRIYNIDKHWIKRYAGKSPDPRIDLSEWLDLNM